MALSDSIFEQNLLLIFTEMENGVMSKEQYAKKLAKCIDDQIKTAQVNAGIPVETAGSASAQKGETTAPGSIS